MVIRPADGTPAGGPGRAREVSRESLEKDAGSALPRVICLVGGDPILASELAERLVAGGVPSGASGFNRESIPAAEIKLRDLASRVEELPLLAAERVILVKGAEALLKHEPEVLARLWPGPGASTILILLAAGEQPGAGRKGPRRWDEVLPAHAIRVAVGTPTREDAVRWGTESAAAAGAQVEDRVWVAAHRRARGDGAKLRTDIELAILAVLCGQTQRESDAAVEESLEEAAERVRGLLSQNDWRAIWPAAEQYRALGGAMDARGAEWVRWVAGQLQLGEAPGTVATLRALATLQLRWRRETGSSRHVLERSALELTITRLGRATERRPR